MPVRARVASAALVTVLAAALVTGAQVAGAAVPAASVGRSTTAAAASSAPTCTLSASTIDPDGRLVHQIFNSDYGKEPYAEGIYTAPAQVTAMAGVSSQFDDVYYPPRYVYDRQFAVRTDRLVFGTTHYNMQKQTKAYVEKKFGTGWGAVRTMVDASDGSTGRTKTGYLYAVSGRTGYLSRHAVSEKTWGSPTVSAAGAKAGFGGVTAMTLAFQYKPWDPAQAVDGVLMTTTKGALYLVTMKRSGAFAPHLVLLRSSTWNFDGLALNNCDHNTWVLLATNSRTRAAVVYEIFGYRRTSTRIGRLAKVPGAWDSRFTASYWSADVPHLDPLLPVPR